MSGDQEDEAGEQGTEETVGEGLRGEGSGTGPEGGNVQGGDGGTEFHAALAFE